MSRQLVTLKRQVREEHTFHQLIGVSKKMRDIFEIVRTVGATDASVMIYGDTGTGKELLARALHQESPRRDKEMVCINSAALTESLLEAELFGYVKGAFTGAEGEKKGRLEIADGSTLFLDEIGHMSLRLQSKLLRFLQDMHFEPVGSNTTRQVNVRILAATNLDLKKEIEEGRFLRDLLYRIEVISIRVPPLKERPEDIPPLVDYYVKKYARQYEKTIREIGSEIMDVLVRYPWPGNVRELKNCLTRLVILSKNGKLSPGDLPETILDVLPDRKEDKKQSMILNIPPEGVTLKDMEEALIRITLERCKGNKSLSAQHLGISRKSLYEKMGRFGIPN
jgi:transcriptional regulator with PAS, ATPase and Fis domain